jgi:hypothetical protein
MEKSGPGDEKAGERLALCNEVTTQVGTAKSGTCGNGGQHTDLRRHIAEYIHYKTIDSLLLKCLDEEHP